MVYPPWKEPVHSGKPTAEELVRYQAYLRSQLSRPEGVRTYNSRPGNFTGIIPSPAQDAICGYLAAHPSSLLREITVGTGLGYDVARRILSKLRSRGIVVGVEDESEYRKPNRWHLTTVGLERAKRVEGVSA